MTHDPTSPAHPTGGEIQRILQRKKVLGKTAGLTSQEAETVCEYIRSQEERIAELEKEKGMMMERITYAMEHGNAALKGVQDKDNAIHHIMSSLSTVSQ